MLVLSKNASSVSSVGRGGCSGGRGLTSAVVLGVGGGVGRGVHGRPRPGLLEALPVGVGPREGGGGQRGHRRGHRLHLDREGGGDGAEEAVGGGVQLALLPLPGLHVVLLEGDGARRAVDLLVEAARVTHDVASCN